MNCTMCGAIIPTGQTNCPMCGATVQADQSQQPVQPQMGYQQPVQPQQPVNPQMGYQQPMQPQQPVNPQMGYQQPVQPVQPQMGYQQPMQPQQPVQPQMGYQQPMQPMNPQMGYQQPMQPQQGYFQPRSNSSFDFGAGVNGYLAYLKSDVMNIVKIAGALLLFLAVLMPWAKAEIWGYSESYNLFHAGGFNAFTAILLLLLSLVLIAWEIADFIPPVAAIKAKIQNIPFMELILVGVVFVLILIATIRAGYVHDDGSTVNMKEWGAEVHRSIGCILSWIAVIAAAAPRVMDKLGIHIGKK